MNPFHPNPYLAWQKTQRLFIRVGRAHIFGAQHAQDSSSASIPPLLLVSANKGTAETRTDLAFGKTYELKELVQYGVSLYQFHSGNFAVIASGTRYKELQVGESG
jgi:hypothetical protein